MLSRKTPGFAARKREEKNINKEFLPPHLENSYMILHQKH